MISGAKKAKESPSPGKGLSALVIHPALAPYRIDLFNALGEVVELEVVFQRGRVAYHGDLDQMQLQSALKVRHERLSGNWVVLNRDVPAGVFSLTRSRQPDVIVTTEFSLVSIFVHLMRRRRPAFGHVIWTSENVDSLASRRAVRLGLRRMLSRRADALILYSPEVADAFAIRCRADRGRMHICANHQEERAVRSRWRNALDAAGEKIEQHDLRGKNVVLFVGRLAPEKNLNVLLLAWRDVASANSDLILVIVGTGSELESLRALALELGISQQIRFVGHQQGNELFAWYRVASVFVLPSRFEPYGAVVNEALLCGVPVLCSESCGARVLIRAGENGACFPVNNSPALAAVIRDWLPHFSRSETALELDRENLMPVPFQRDVNGFVAALRQSSAQNIPV